MNRLKNTHPGEILKEEFLEPFGLKQYQLAEAIDVQPICISQIVNGKRSISPKVGLKLSRFFGMSDGFWIGLQMDHDMREIKNMKNAFKHIIPYKESNLSNHTE